MVVDDDDDDGGSGGGGGERGCIKPNIYIYKYQLTRNRRTQW